MSAVIGVSNVLNQFDLFPLGPIFSGFSSDRPFENALSTALYQKAETTGIASIAYDAGTAHGIDYVAFHDHNFASSETYVIVGMSGQGGSFTYTEDGTAIHFFDNTAGATTLSITFVSPSTSSFSYISAGSRLDLNPLRVPFEPPRKGNVSIQNSESLNGQFLGRVTRPEPMDLDIKQDFVPESWIDANWDELLKLNSDPFFFLWDKDRPQDACLAWTREPIKRPRYDQYGWQTFDIKARAQM